MKKKFKKQRINAIFLSAIISCNRYTAKIFVIIISF